MTKNNRVGGKALFYSFFVRWLGGSLNSATNEKDLFFTASFFHFNG